MQLDTMSAALDYATFLERKAQLGGQFGFAPTWMPPTLFDFQTALVEWALRKGRAAIFADCGLGKSRIQIAWAENIVRHTNRPVLILTPLAVSAQTIREGAAIEVEVRRPSGHTSFSPALYVANYERLHLFDPADFAGVVCDESSCIKNFSGVRRGAVTEFMRKLPYRLLCTATAAPNDFIELGTSSEALGELGHMDMLTRFFKNEQNTNNPNRLWEGAKWRFKKHAEQPFWRWVCSWARALRRPSDMGFSDNGFVLPALSQTEHVVKARAKAEGFLFDMPAVGLKEQRDERRRTIAERCERAAALAREHDTSVLWCHLNAEGDLLETLLPDCVQVSGADSDEEKEEKLLAFIDGQCSQLVSKPIVAGFGLNLQRCAHVATFPSHSFEQYYQSVRRCWRFGQARPVNVDMISSEGERGVLRNLQRKAAAADRMFSELVATMNDSLSVKVDDNYLSAVEAPAWL